MEEKLSPMEPWMLPMHEVFVPTEAWRFQRRKIFLQRRVSRLHRMKNRLRSRRARLRGRRAGCVQAFRARPHAPPRCAGCVRDGDVTRTATPPRCLSQRLGTPREAGRAKHASPPAPILAASKSLEITMRWARRWSPDCLLELGNVLDRQRRKEIPLGHIVETDPLLVAGCAFVRDCQLWG